VASSAFRDTVDFHGRCPWMSKPKTANRAVAPPPRKSPPSIERMSYTFAETAEMLGASPRQLKRWHLDGRIRAMKPSGPKGPTFFTAEEIQRCVREWSK